MADGRHLEESVARLLAAADPSAAPTVAPRFDDPLTDAFSIAAAANRDRIRAADPEVETDLPPDSALAAASGLMIAPQPLRPGWWHSLPAPLVVDLDSSTPAAIVPDSAGRALLFPPGSRTARRVHGRTSPGGRAVRLTSRLPEDLRWWQLLCWSIRGQHRSLSVLVGLACLTGVTGLLLPLATSALFQYAIPWGDLAKAGAVLLVFAIASAAAAVLLLARNGALIGLRDTSDERMSAGLMATMLRLPMGFFGRLSRGDLLSRTMSVEQARTIVDDSVLMLILTAVFGVTNLAFLASLSTQISLYVGIAVVVLVSASVAVQNQAKRALTEVLSSRAAVTGTTMELINAAVLIRVAAAEDRAFSLWSDSAVPWLEDLSKRMLRLNAVQPLTALAPLVIDLVLVLSVLAMSTPIPAREFVPAFAAVVQLTVAMTLLSQNLSRLWEIGPVLRRMDPITTEEPERNDQGRTPGALTGRIAVSNVVFGYDPDQPPLLDGVSFSVDAGEFVAIVGPSGSGKTTLLRLLLGFERPWSGIVEYDGNDLAELDVVAVRRQMGTVTQASVPFGTTLRECICGPRVIDEQRLQDVLARSGLSSLAADLGLDTDIGARGTALSGGQQQRLMIARALVGETRILLLDEATSALDNLTQEIVMEAVTSLRATRIAIAHRLSTIEHADRVLVVDGGQIVEDGPPAELRSRGGHFARLAARQEF